MIISRTPYRISFFGGGTDHPSWYEYNESIIISSTINKYSYINIRNLPPYFNYKYKLRYFLNEQVSKIDKIKHPVIRECLKNLNYTKKGIEMVHSGDIPARSGVGSSSSFTVGFLNALFAHIGYTPTKRELALKALEIEQDILKESVGSQDQIAAAFGGFNKIRLSGNNFNVDPLTLSKKSLNKIEDSILFCYTGLARTSEFIAKKQINNISKKKTDLIKMTELSKEALKILNKKNFSIKEFGKLLNEQWILKQNLNPSSTNKEINHIYSKALSAGAFGGKISGAGAGGFLLILAPSDRHYMIRKKLSKYLFVPIRLENTGSQIVYYSHS